MLIENKTVFSCRLSRSSFHTISYMKKNIPLDILSSPERVILDLRRAGFKEVIVIGKYHYNEAHHQLPTHSHRNMLEICFCSKGGQTYEVNNELFRVNGNEVFVTYPGEWHGTGKYPEEKGELYWIIVKLDPKIKTRQFLHFDEKIASEWSQQLLSLPRHFKGNRILKIKLEKAFELFAQRKDTFNLLQLQHQIADCLLEIINCSKKASPVKKSDRMARLNLFIQHNLDQPVELSKLASVTGLSLSHFKSWFKEETGTTPLDYVLRFKIEQAQQLLRKKEIAITSIAFETGFQNSQYFASVFRKFTGMSPSEYRKES